MRYKLLICEVRTTKPLIDIYHIEPSLSYWNIIEQFVGDELEKLRHYSRFIDSIFDMPRKEVVVSLEQAIAVMREIVEAAEGSGDSNVAEKVSRVLREFEARKGRDVAVGFVVRASHF